MNDISRPAIVVVMIVAALVQSSVAWHFPLFGIVWLPMLQIVTFLALWYGPVGGAGWGFVGGLLIDVFSDAHWGLSALALTIAGLSGRICRKRRPAQPGCGSDHYDAMGRRRIFRVTERLAHHV